jgi:hypothetical protein
MPRLTLRELPSHMRNKPWVSAEIVYEGHKGVHTYHQCECGRGLARNIQCETCWREVLGELCSRPKRKGRKVR